MAEISGFATTLVYRLKNRSDRKALAPIAGAAVEFIKGWVPKVDTIVPVPPSRKRVYQPVLEIAKAIGELLSLPVILRRRRRSRIFVLPRTWRIC